MSSLLAPKAEVAEAVTFTTGMTAPLSCACPGQGRQAFLRPALPASFRAALCEDSSHEVQHYLPMRSSMLLCVVGLRVMAHGGGAGINSQVRFLLFSTCCQEIYCCAQRLVYSFNKYLLSAYWVPGSMPGHSSTKPV